ncbi:origin recognition complex subunit 5 [Euwallacea similis]|uniref:origin recognition complex subunit 5 n=1 Tax=Euwallacea similis TaxID=1736056 RepID=UPI0034506021
MASTLTNNQFLRGRYPAREAQITQLLNFFDTKEDPFPVSLYLFGSPATGKSTIVTSVLQTLHIKHALVNLIECYTSKILFETILNQLTKLENKVKCDNLMEFIGHVQEMGQQERWVIVLDKAEELRNMEYNLLTGFLMLQQLTEAPVCVILVSEIAFEKFYYKLNVIEPIKVFFPQYSKQELLEVLSLDYEHMCDLIDNIEFDMEFFKNYLSIFLSVFYGVCRDLRELQHMSRKIFLPYCEPIEKKELQLSDSMALWRHISPIFSLNLEYLYLRVSTNNQTTLQKVTQSFELPFYAKFLLIAAFLASYNSPKDDKRLFMKFHGKKRKTLKQVKNKSKASEELNVQIGPKLFTLDRLLAIFYSILEDKVGFNNHLLVQVSSLVELQLLALVSDESNLDLRKYKCVVNFQVIQEVSRMVGFNIRKYLSDFSHN